MDSTEVCAWTLDCVHSPRRLFQSHGDVVHCMVYDMVCATVAVLDRETVGRQTHHIVQGSETDGMAVVTDESREASGLTAN